MRRTTVSTPPSPRWSSNVPLGGYRFRHPLIRDALLEAIPPHRRRVLHRLCAERLAALEASPARIGHHLLAAGDSAAAVPHVLRAAETAAAVGAYRDALSLVDSIREVAERVGRTTGRSPCGPTCSPPSAIRPRCRPTARRSRPRRRAVSAPCARAWPGSRFSPATARPPPRCWTAWSPTAARTTRRSCSPRPTSPTSPVTSTVPRRRCPRRTVATPRSPPNTSTSSR